MNAVLIDDEELNISLLENFLKKYCPSVKVVGTADCVDKALEVVIQGKPDVIFLDIELHDKTAKDLLNFLELDAVQIVIISAYEKYALEMHKFPVTDYLLKPLSISDLILAVTKVQKNIDKRKILEAEQHAGEDKYIAVPEKDYMNIMKLSDITRMDGNGAYTFIFTIDGKKITSAKTLKEYEDILPKSKFIRAHKSHIVNIQFVSKYLKTKYGVLVLKDGTEIPISANRRKEVTERIIF